MALPKAPAVALSAIKSKALSEAIIRLQGSESSVKSISLGVKRETGGSSNWLSNALSWALGQLGGFLVWGAGALARAFSFSLTSLVSWVQAGTYFIWTFNWSMTDQEIAQQIESAKVGIASLLGGAAGELAGYLTCGATAGGLLYVFNPQMAAYVLKELGEEGLEEFLGYIYSLASTTFQTSAYFAFVKLYQSNRALFHLWRDLAGTALDSVVPGQLSWTEYVKQRQADGGYLSFAGFIEESVETLNPVAAAFFEEFFEEVFEGCFEALYVVGGSAEAWIAEQRVQQQIQAQQKVVQVIPNREIEKESVILAGDTQSLKPAITSVLATYQLVENRDVGAIVGQPVPDYLAANPQSLRIIIEMMSVREPPWTDLQRGGRRAKRVTIAVPDLDRTKLDWEKIKFAVGGENGYLYGRFRATAFLSNGRQMAVYCASEEEAEQLMARLLTLSQAELLRLSITEEKREGELAKRPGLLKQVVRVYPAYFTILNRREYFAPREGETRQSLRQNYQDRKVRIPLYPKQKPDWADQAIADLLRFGTVR
ncbi:hypothetical protein QYC27_10535 [Thermosynechococcus sp. PP45]|uniref:hypothetical protein n=1 Tax=Thermosynechococcus sp. PP45 TaxID=3058429 RepID=UPI002673C5BA|nr:hypothetical protein [Thermosynechococcus sp. PP45]WKT80721.1 hypothetical protein QYC27_10535 [Thermosynechococcus sp. PP45]